MPEPPQRLIQVNRAACFAQRRPSAKWRVWSKGLLGAQRSTLGASDGRIADESERER